MADNNSKTVLGTFETREAADLAVEHLVQQYGIARADVFVRAKGDVNSSGIIASGGDASHAGKTRTDAPLWGTIEVSADIVAGSVENAKRAFVEVGAIEVRSR